MASYTKLGTETPSDHDHHPISKAQGSSSSSNNNGNHVNRADKYPKLAPLLDEEGDHVPYSDNDLEMGSAAKNDDPFYVFREDLIRKMKSADSSLDRYLSLVFDTDTAVNTHDVKDAKKQCKRGFKQADSALTDLQKTVRLVESSRGLPQFQHIDDDELISRQSFIASNKQKLSTLKDRMQAQDIKNKLTKDQRALSARRSGNLGARNAAEQKNTDFIIDQRASAQIMMSQQDEVIDDLGEAVTRVGAISSTINSEIADQTKMLKSLDDDLADAEEKLGLVMGKLGKFLKTKDKCQIGTILCLTLIVIILFVCVIYL